VYKAKVFPRLKNLTSLSDPLIQSHVRIYEGYVRASNTIAERLRQISDESACDPMFSELAELRRRQPFAYNGMLLHELYFDALGPDEGSSPALDTLVEAYGGRSRVLSDLVNTSLCGIGWSLLTQRRPGGPLSVSFVADHHIGLMLGHDVLLAIDSWEHAFTADYGTDRARYATSVTQNVDWRVVSSRLGSQAPIEAPLLRRQSAPLGSNADARPGVAAGR
jgi:Fe-Mn family superoxide dismutase